jgi:hypothetical protein
MLQQSTVCALQSLSWMVIDQNERAGDGSSWRCMMLDVDVIVDVGEVVASSWSQHSICCRSCGGESSHGE